MDPGTWILAVTLLLTTSPSLQQRQNWGAENQKRPFHLHEGTCSSLHSDLASQNTQNLFSEIGAEDCALANPYDYPPNHNPKNNEEYDFIIVGAGSAGAVVANRLTEKSNWRVLLLEAGGNPTKTSEVPAMFPALQKTELDWQYKTDSEEKNCLGFDNKQCNWPRGKMLGGSSSINYMLYVRGNRKDYDQWEAEGNTGWGYDSVLPYFKKSENLRAEEILSTTDFTKYHGTEGNVKVESWLMDELKPLANAFAEGMKELGYPNNTDYNGENPTGFVTFQRTLENGRRCSTAKAFLIPATKRRNLKVSKYSLVSKILIDKKKKTAHGIEFINRYGEVINAYARKEVILSAGAINTPQLLMLSGIGPRKHLEELNISVVEDLPVGENLQDHLLMTGLVISVNYSKSSDSSENNMFDFLLKRKNNRLSGAGMISYGGFINTMKDVDYPDIEYLLIDFDKNDTTGLLNFLNILGVKNDIKQKYIDINNKSYTIIVLCSLLRPYSKGNVKLQSTLINDHPKLTSGYFSDDRDIETFLRTYRFVTQLVQSNGLQSVNAELHEIEIQGCNSYEFASRAYRECSLRHLTTTTYHQCCSSRMGPASDKRSVVDPQLRVKGVNRLRVIDASVMPNEVSGNINAAVVMIGEKGSDLIKETWPA